MTDDRRVLGMLGDVLATYPGRAPDHLLASILGDVAKTPQRRRWLRVPRRTPTEAIIRPRGVALLLGVGGVIAAIAVIGSQLSLQRVPGHDSVGASPSMSPLMPSASVDASRGPDEVIPGRFRLTGSMMVGREGPTATLLRDGRVVVIGGYSTQAARTAEVFDPRTEVFTATGSLLQPRSLHSAILLSDGRVLIVGGIEPDAGSGNGDATSLAEAEVWDPATNRFSSAGSLHLARTRARLTLMSDGRVLVAGGEDFQGLPSQASGVTELWDPATNSFSPSPPDPAPQSDPGVVVVNLLDGRSLVLDNDSARVWDRSARTFSGTGDPVRLRYHRTTSAIALADGRVLLVGGQTFGEPYGIVRAAEIWDPATGEFRPTASTIHPRLQHRAVLLADGRVLIVGNSDESAAMTSAEIFELG